VTLRESHICLFVYINMRVGFPSPRQTNSRQRTKELPLMSGNKIFYYEFKVLQHCLFYNKLYLLCYFAALSNY
jgi:hypothetical protein